MATEIESLSDHRNLLMKIGISVTDLLTRKYFPMEKLNDDLLEASTLLKAWIPPLADGFADGRVGMVNETLREISDLAMSKRSASGKSLAY